MVSSKDGAHDLLAGIPQLEDLPPVDGRRVLVRVDFNVPLRDGPDGGRVVEDDFRIRATLGTLEWLASRGASVTACTHLGRPKGRPDPRYDVAPVRERLSELAPGVALLDNLRFDPREEAGDVAFAAELCRGFDCFVNDAFGASHRAHASIVGPPNLLPAAAGRVLAREVDMLGRLVTRPPRPYVAVVGGAKVADKLGVLGALLRRADTVLVAGGMAFTFLAAQGHPIGRSLLDADDVGECRELLAQAGDRLVLPVDVVALSPEGSIGSGARGGGTTLIVGDDLPEGWQGVDVGPKTAADFAARISRAAAVFWNGPMGAFEDERFASGTRAVAEAVASCPGYTVVGGGDTVAALDALGLAGEVTFVSTGGGASLEFLEHGDLPGLAALRAAPNAPRRPPAPAR